jgi:hypothetical protein
MKGENELGRCLSGRTKGSGESLKTFSMAYAHRLWDKASHNNTLLHMELKSHKIQNVATVT